MKFSEVVIIGCFIGLLIVFFRMPSTSQIPVKCEEKAAVLKTDYAVIDDQCYIKGWTRLSYLELSK